MVGRGKATQRFRVTVAGAVLVLAVSGCRGALQPTASPGASGSAPSPTEQNTLAPSPTDSATLAASPTPVVDESASFRFVPGEPPQGDTLPGETPTITCDGPIGANDPVAVVQLRASEPNLGPVVLRDYADVANPRTVCTLKAGVYQILDARHLLVGYGLGYAVVDLPEVRYHWFKLPATPGYGATLAAVSPTLDRVVWYSNDPEGTGTDTIHVTTATADTVVASVVDHNTGRCGQPDDSQAGGFSSSGAYSFVLVQPFQAESSLTVLHGLTPVVSIVPPAGDWPEGGHPAMALWSPTSETLYYRQGTDVWRWTPGAEPMRFLANTVWYYPTISPDGKHLVYAVTRAADSFHDSYIVDLVHGGAPKLIGTGLRNQPVFLNNTQLWVRAEGTGEPCGPTGVGPRIYNIVTGVESTSVIESVYKVWPATSSNW